MPLFLYKCQDVIDDLGTFDKVKFYQAVQVVANCPERKF